MEGGKMGHLLKFPEMYFLVGTETRALKDHPGTDSNSQGSAPQSPSVGHRYETMLRACSGSV